MTREDAILCLKGIKNYGRDTFTEQSDWQESLDMAIKALEQEPIINKLKVEINKNIEQEDFARSVFINEEKDYRKANQCTGNLQAYEKVLDMIDNLLKENKICHRLH